MASDHLPNYLLSHRKRSTLSQKEVAFLLGVQSGAKVCRHESFARDPDLETALAYAAIYQQPISELFPGLVEQIQDGVRARAKILAQKELNSNSSAMTARKRESIAAIVSAEFNHQHN
jgi:transcriptional regulator with XRE-family HTH domain